MMKKPWYRFSYLTAGALAWILLVLISPTEAQAISADNTSRYIGAGRWDWTIFIRAPQNVLSEIECVEYTLHPTFPNPVQEVCNIGEDPRYPFGYSTNGWGVFEISIKVTFRNRSVQHLKHMLSFKVEPIQNTSTITVDNNAEKMRDGRWRWTVFIQGQDSDLDMVRCVKYILHHTFSNPEREVCIRGTGPHVFALTASGWGIFKLKIRVFFQDGRVQDLTHKLKF